MARDVPVRFPCTVTVSELVLSRYDALYLQGVLQRGQRPLSWDDRSAGVDVIRTADGLELRLLSDGGQSPPHPGWQLVLRGGSCDEGYSWTLYAMPPGAE